MINLLPDDQKHEIQAGRMNVTLLSYNLMTLMAFGVLVMASLLFYFILNNSQASAAATSDNNIKKAASFATVKREADAYRNNLSIANAILDKSVNYTSVLFKITELLPTGVTLDNISLNASDFGQQTSFAAHAKSYAAATELKENFQNSKIFSNVFFQSLTDAAAAGSLSDPDYPISVTISAKLSKDAS